MNSLQKLGDHMRRKAKKKEVDLELLHTIYELQWEWKQIQNMVDNSIEPMEESLYKQSIAQSKYLFLLREARYRKLSAIRYH